MLWFIKKVNTREVAEHNLNTSYVMVHPSFLCLSAPISQFKYILCYGSSQPRLQFHPKRFYLNTSYVMVHRIFMCQSWHIKINLNTSYVMVHLTNYSPSYVVYTFKYILCYGSSLSYVAALNNSGIFKYILCYGSSM